MNGIGSAAPRRKPSFQRHPWDRAFYLTFAIAACAVIFLAFGPTYFFRLADVDANISGIVHVHAAVFSAWMLLFLVQTTLVETGNTRLHMTLGAAGLVLALAVVAVGFITAVEGGRTGYLGPGVPRDTEFSRMFMVVPLRDMVWFTGALVLAILFRGRPETHKRLMVLLIVGGLMPVALARVPGAAAAIIGFGSLLAPPIYDLVTRRRLHVVYAVGVPLFVLSSMIVQPVAESAAWARIADWLVG